MQRPSTTDSLPEVITPASTIHLSQRLLVQLKLPKSCNGVMIAYDKCYTSVTHFQRKKIRWFRTTIKIFSFLRSSWSTAMLSLLPFLGLYTVVSKDEYDKRATPCTDTCEAAKRESCTDVVNLQLASGYLIVIISPFKGSQLLVLTL